MPGGLDLPKTTGGGSKAAGTMRRRVPRVHLDTRYLDVSLDEAMQILHLNVTGSRPSSNSRSRQRKASNKAPVAKMLGPSQRKTAMTASFGCLAAPGCFGSLRNAAGQLQLPAATLDLAGSPCRASLASSAAGTALSRSASQPMSARTGETRSLLNSAPAPPAGISSTASSPAAVPKDPIPARASSSSGPRDPAMKAKLHGQDATYQATRRPSQMDTSMALYALAKESNISYADLHTTCDLFRKYAQIGKQDDLFEARLSMMQFEHVLCDMCNVSSPKELSRDFIYTSFAVADRDRGGDLDLREFVEFYTASSFDAAVNCGEDEAKIRILARDHDMNMLDMEKVRETFLRYDVDKSGQIELCKFRTILIDLLKLRPGQELPQERVNALWRMADKKDKGVLDFEQFLAFYQMYFDDEAGGLDPNSAFYKSFRRV